MSFWKFAGIVICWSVVATLVIGLMGYASMFECSARDVRDSSCVEYSLIEEKSND
jgi:hypothetical protein